MTSNVPSYVPAELRDDGRAAEMSIDLPCHLCGYDVRAHPHDGKCPECGASVAESRRVAAMPRRPAWRDSDPRWRRRMLAGTWLLVFLPLMAALRAFGWDSSVPVPTVFHYYQGAANTLDDALVSFPAVYQPVFFCIGVVLLFAKERGRRPARLDWTRRWGILCTYVVFLLSAAQVLFIGALVLAGVAAVFQSMPLKYQPPVTQLLVDMSSGYLRYGPLPMNLAGIVQVAFTSIAILLACVPLFDALRSTGGSKRIAAILLAPLALFSLMHLANLALYCLGFSAATSAAAFQYWIYFWPDLPLRYLAGSSAGVSLSGSELIALFVECAKWCIVLAIAVWFSIAQLATWRRRTKKNSA